jgi:hypothetical protein
MMSLAVTGVGDIAGLTAAVDFWAIVVALRCGNISPISTYQPHPTSAVIAITRGQI